MANIEFSNKTLVEGEIGNALKSTASDHVVAAAQNIYDTEFTTLTSNIGNNKGAYQNDINKYLLDRINENPVGTVTSITPGTGLTGTSSDSAITSSGTINLKPASTTEIGGIKLGYEETDASNRNYKVQVNTDNKAFVYVPWTDTKVTSDTHYKALGTTKASGLYKTTIDEAGHITAATAVTKSDITNLLPNNIPSGWLGTSSSTAAAGDHTHTAYITNEILTNTLTSKGYITKTAVEEGYQPKGNYLTSVSAATTTELGGIKIANKRTSNITTTQGGTETSAKYYGIEIDSGNKAFVNVPWTDTHVTNAENHYEPSQDSTATLSVDAEGSSSASWNSTSLVTGVNIQRDSKGHVTNLTLDSVKMPTNPLPSNIPTKWLGTSSSTAAAGNHTHDAYITAVNSENHYKALGTTKTSGLYKTTIDEAGHITAATVVEASDITKLGIASTAAATTSAAGLMTAADKTKLNGIATGANNYSLPTASGSILGGIKVGSNLSITNDGTLSATDTTYSVGTGLVLSGTTFKTKLKSEAAATYESNTITTTQNRYYAVVPDKLGYLSVNVPWTDTDEKVKYTDKSTSTTEYSLGFKPSTVTNGNTGEVYYSDNLKYKPSTNTITGNVTGYSSGFKCDGNGDTAFVDKGSNIQCLEFSFADNGGRDVYKLIADLTDWETKTVTRRHQLIGTLYGVRDGNMSGNGAYSITAGACSWNGGNTYKLYIDSCKLDQTSSGLKNYTITPCIVKYNGTKYLALKKVGSGQIGDYTIKFVGIAKGLLETYINKNITVNGDIENETGKTIEVISNTNFKDGHAITTESYCDGTNINTLLHSNNFNKYASPKLTVTTTSGSTISLVPNIMYVCTNSGEVTISSITAPAANEIVTYSLFIPSGYFSFSPTNIYWANGEKPDSTSGAYEVVINGINTGSNTYYTATWSKYEQK